MRGALENSTAVGALALEHTAGVMQPVGQHMDVGVGPRHQLAIVPDEAIDPVERNSHGHFSPSNASRGDADGFYVKSGPPAKPVSTLAECAKSSMFAISERPGRRRPGSSNIS